MVVDLLSCIRALDLVRIFESPHKGAVRHMVREAWPVIFGWNGMPPESPDPISWSRKSEYGVKVTLLRELTTCVCLPKVWFNVTLERVVKFTMWQTLQPMLLNTASPAVKSPVFGGIGARSAMNCVILIMLV